MFISLLSIINQPYLFIVEQEEEDGVGLVLTEEDSTTGVIVQSIEADGAAGKVQHCYTFT